MQHTCKQCGSEFHARPGRDAKYCSNRCRQNAFRGVPAGTRFARVPIAVLNDTISRKTSWRGQPALTSG